MPEFMPFGHFMRLTLFPFSTSSVHRLSRVNYQESRRLVGKIHYWVEIGLASLFGGLQNGVCSKYHIRGRLYDKLDGSIQIITTLYFTYYQFSCLQSSARMIRK